MAEAGIPVSPLASSPSPVWRCLSAESWKCFWFYNQLLTFSVFTSYESVRVCKKRKKVVDKDSRATNSLHLQEKIFLVNRLFLIYCAWSMSILFISNKLNKCPFFDVVIGKTVKCDFFVIEEMMTKHFSWTNYELFNFSTVVVYQVFSNTSFPRLINHFGGQALKRYRTFSQGFQPESYSWKYL